MLDHRVAGYLLAAFGVAACLAVEPLDPSKKTQKNYDPEPYFFRIRRNIQERLKKRDE
jgi:hypothetical protein